MVLVCVPHQVPVASIQQTRQLLVQAAYRRMWLADQQQMHSWIWWLSNIQQYLMQHAMRIPNSIHWQAAKAGQPSKVPQPRRMCPLEQVHV